MRAEGGRRRRGAEARERGEGKGDGGEGGTDREKRYEEAAARPGGKSGAHCKNCARSVRGHEPVREGRPDSEAEHERRGQRPERAVEAPLARLEGEEDEEDEERSRQSRESAERAGDGTARLELAAGEGEEERDGTVVAARRDARRGLVERRLEAFDVPWLEEQREELRGEGLCGDPPPAEALGDDARVECDGRRVEACDSSRSATIAAHEDGASGSGSRGPGRSAPQTGRATRSAARTTYLEQRADSRRHFHRTAPHRTSASGRPRLGSDSPIRE